MPHHDLYDSLRLDRTQSCDELAVELDNRLTALGPQGGPRVPEMQAARAVLAHPGRRSLYDSQLADATTPPITPEDIMVLAELDPGAASRPHRPNMGTVQDWGVSAASRLDSLRKKATAWSDDATRESTRRARAAADRYGAHTSRNGRPDVGARVGALFIDAGCVVAAGLVIAIPALTYMFRNLSATVSAAAGGDFSAIGDLLRMWRFTGSASALLPLTALLIAVALTAYCIGSEALWGASIGKKMLGCRVVTPEGKRPDLAAAAKRNWWPVLFFLPAVGILLWIAMVIALAVTILIDRRGLSFLDKWAGVAVVPATAAGQPTASTYDWGA